MIVSEVVSHEESTLRTDTKVQNVRLMLCRERTQTLRLGKSLLVSQTVYQP